MHGYFHTSRAHTHSLLFALPLLVLYEAGARWIAEGGGTPLRNGADVLLRVLLAGGGVRGTLAFTGLLVLVGLVLVAHEQRRRRVRPRAAVFAAMALESAAWALVFGLAVGTATQWLLDGLAQAGVRLAAGPTGTEGLAQGVVLSLGAGIYEELVFRVLLAGGLFVVFREAGLARGRAGAFAAVLAALLFAAFHYVGPYAYPLDASSFTFRFLAGLALNALFLLRGFGIAAWTHALYDIFLLLSQG